MPAKPTIFISYRRQPAADLARYIHHRLSTLRYNVFLDVETINGGRFANIIQHEIKGRDVFVVILTPETLQSEWVVREIKTALENQKPIVPLAAQGFSFAMPLPAEITELSDYDAVRWDNDFAEAAFERLVKAIDPQSHHRARPAWQGVGALVSVAVLIVLLAVFAPTIFNPAASSTATATASNTSAPTTAIPFVNMPTGVQIMNLDTTATEIVLQRTVDAKETANGEAFAESTRIVETARAQATAAANRPATTATRVIDLGATATEAILERTVVAQGVINATLLAENTRIVETSTLTATSSPTSAALTETPHSTSGLVVGSTASAQLPPGYNSLPIRSTTARNASMRAELAEGDVVTILEGPLAADRLLWWRVRTANGIEGWAAETLGGNHQVLIPITTTATPTVSK